MKSEEIEKLLEDVPNPISHIERDLGIPATVLQKALKGKRNLPKKWAIALKLYVETKRYLLSVAIPDTPTSKKEVVKEAEKTNKAEEKPAKKYPANDPKEGSLAFFSKYGVSSYQELEKIKTK